jgi:hypothetical protein
LSSIDAKCRQIAKSVTKRIVSDRREKAGEKPASPAELKLRFFYPSSRPFFRSFLLPLKGLHPPLCLARAGARTRRAERLLACTCNEPSKSCTCIGARRGRRVLQHVQTDVEARTMGLHVQGVRKERARIFRSPRSFSLLGKGIGVRCQRPARLLALTLAAEDVRSRSRSSAPRPLPPPDGGAGGSKEKKPPSADALRFDLTRGELGGGDWVGLGPVASSLPPNAPAPIDVVGVGVAKPPPAPATCHLTEIGRRAACLRWRVACRFASEAALRSSCSFWIRARTTVQSGSGWSASSPMGISTTCH